MLLCPFVVEFVDHQYTIFVTKPDEVATIRIVRRADVVQSELLHQLDAFLDGTRIGCSSQSAQSVVVGITLQQYLLAIQLQTKVRTYLNGANAKLLTHLVSHTSILTYQSDYCCVKVGMLCVPELWIWNLHLREFGLHGTSRRDAFATILSLVNQLPLWVVDFQSYASCARLGAIGQFCGYVDEAVVTRCDIQWMALEIEVGRSLDEVDVAIQSSTCVPTGVLLIHGGRLDHQHVITLPQLIRDVNLKAHIAIVRTPHALAIQKDIAHEHDAFEI